jgi:hypothetical protein
MSHQVDNAISDVDQAMKQLKRAMDGIPVRREGFTDLRRRFVRSVSVLTTETSYARSQLPHR